MRNIIVVSGGRTAHLEDVDGRREMLGRTPADRQHTRQRQETRDSVKIIYCRSMRRESGLFFLLLVRERDDNWERGGGA